MPKNIQKSYPSRCIQCGKKRVQPAMIRHEVKKNHDGRAYELVIEQLPVNRCASCSEIYFTNDSDDAISAALRLKLNLLAPEEIRANIESLGIQQKQLADCLGVAPETMSRWINGAMIQSRAMDNLLRAYFGSAEVRTKLKGETMDLNFGRTVRIAPAVEHLDEQRWLYVQTCLPQLSQHVHSFGNHDRQELMQVIHLMIDRPQMVHPFAQWSRALIGAFCGRDPLSRQGELFGRSSNDATVESREKVFESLASEFAEIPLLLRSDSLESMLAVLHAQRKAIDSIRHQSLDAMHETQVTD